MHPSDYHMSTFKQLYNKLVAIKTALQNFLANLRTAKSRLYSVKNRTDDMQTVSATKKKFP